MEIFIVSRNVKNDELIKQLEGSSTWDSEAIDLVVRKNHQDFRVIDPTVLVAVVSAAGAGLGALISGLLNVAKESRSSKLVIRDKDGRTIEIPADYPMTKVKELVEVIRQMETAKIEIP